ncbi:MAG: hypothetical protein AAFS10_26140 [Myxococcota bacterium]
MPEPFNTWIQTARLDAYAIGTQVDDLCNVTMKKLYSGGYGWRRQQGIEIWLGSLGGDLIHQLKHRAGLAKQRARQSEGPAQVRAQEERERLRHALLDAYSRCDPRIIKMAWRRFHDTPFGRLEHHSPQTLGLSDLQWTQATFANITQATILLSEQHALSLVHHKDEGLIAVDLKWRPYYHV